MMAFDTDVLTDKKRGSASRLDLPNLLRPVMSRWLFHLSYGPFPPMNIANPLAHSSGSSLICPRPPWDLGGRASAVQNFP